MARTRGRQIGQLLGVEPLRALALEAFAVQEHGVDVASGIAGSFVTAAALAAGLASGNRIAGLTAAIGALNVALCVPRAHLRTRLLFAGLVAFAGLGDVIIAYLVNRHTWLVAVVTFAWIAAWTTLRAGGQQGALAGFAISAMFVILAGAASTGPPLGERMWWFAAGAAGAMVLMVSARDGTTSTTTRTLASTVTGGIREDPVLRLHVLRLSLAVTIATVIERVAHISHGYWVPLTVLAILQPQERATQIRVVQRAAGTLVGVLVIVVATALTSNSWVMVGCTALTAFWLFALDERGYFWLVVMLTPTALAMLSVYDFQGTQVGVERTLDSGLGIVLGLAIGELGWMLGGRSRRA